MINFTAEICSIWKIWVKRSNHNQAYKQRLLQLTKVRDANINIQKIGRIEAKKFKKRK